jgi:hypothetical protein
MLVYACRLRLAFWVKKKKKVVILANANPSAGPPPSTLVMCAASIRLGQRASASPPVFFWLVCLSQASLSYIFFFSYLVSRPPLAHVSALILVGECSKEYHYSSHRFSCSPCKTQPSATTSVCGYGATLTIDAFYVLLVFPPCAPSYAEWWKGQSHTCPSARASPAPMVSPAPEATSYMSTTSKQALLSSSLVVRPPDAAKPARLGARLSSEKDPGNAAILPWRTIMPSAIALVPMRDARNKREGRASFAQTGQVCVCVCACVRVCVSAPGGVTAHRLSRRCLSMRCERSSRCASEHLDEIIAALPSRRCTRRNKWERLRAGN